MLESVPLSILAAILITLLFFSGFFSGSETSLMAVNRYKIKHQAQSGSRGAMLVERLLSTPDRLIGLLLLGNNIVNIAMSVLATVVAVRVFGDAGIAVATIGLTVMVLLFGEVAPKTVAALHAERVATRVAFVLVPLQYVAWPFVWVINRLVNGLLRVMGVPLNQRDSHSLSQQELRTILSESAGLIPQDHQKMLTNILDLESATVDEIMVPRSEIVGIDLAAPMETIIEQLCSTPHTRVPMWRNDPNEIAGVLHVRKVLREIAAGNLTSERLQAALTKPYFIPEGARLTQQLLEFQQRERRMGLVVDEYGDVQGLVTIDDILEEIVGEFTTEPNSIGRRMRAQPDGSWLVDGRANLRTLNRRLDFGLPTEEASTINGLLLERLQDLPIQGTMIEINDCQLHIEAVEDNQVSVVRIARITPVSDRNAPDG